MKIDPRLYSRAVDCLLRPDNSIPLKKIQQQLKTDPNFLSYHSGSISLEVIHLLMKDPGTWNVPYDPNLITKILREALSRLEEL